MPKDPQLVSAFDEDRDKKTPETISYSADEEKYFTFLKKRLTTARSNREKEYKEFNNRPYTVRYKDNMQKAYTMLQPLENDEDTSVDAGTIRFKIETLMSAILNLNFKAEVRAYDKQDTEDQILGEACTDMIEKSEVLEDWNRKKVLAYWEMISQGNVFIEEVWVDEVRIDKKKIKLSDAIKDKEIRTVQQLKETFSGCKRNLIAGTQLFVGNVKEPTIENQPYIFTRDEIPYEQAKVLYGNWDRFKFVPKTLKYTVESWDDTWFLLDEIKENFVEVIKYQDKFNDCYQIFLNGVMMLPMVECDGKMQGFPMPWEHGEYNIIKGDLEPIHPFFFYSRALPEKLKFEDEVFNEMFRLMVLSEQKKFMPPVANNSGENLNKVDFLPGKVLNDVDPNKIGVVGGPYGNDNSTFNMMEFMKGVMNDKSVSQLLSGVAPDGKQTATEITAMMQQAKQQMGLILHGFEALHETLGRLRLYNILENWTKPMGKKIDEVVGGLKNKYRTISLEKQLEGKGLGTKMIRMTETPKGSAGLMAEEMGYDYPGMTGQEQSIYDFKGAPTKKPMTNKMTIIELNPKELRNCKYDYKIEVTPAEKDTSLTAQTSFMNSLMTAMQIWPGIQNNPEIKERFAIYNDFDPKSLEINQGIPMQQPQGGQPQPQPGMKTMGADMMAGKL